ncbi:MAG: sigma-70 family RNA polymerase sigma factor [Planctomycetota bacterium]
MSQSLSQHLEDPSETIRLLRLAAHGEQGSWQELMERHRDRLDRMVRLRLDARMQARVDASDVIQDAFVEAWKKLPQFLSEPKMTFFLWLRSITTNKLMALHRFHLGTEQRSAGREVSLFRGAIPASTTAALAANLIGGFTQPSDAAIRSELKLRLQEALNQLDPIDREILTLRHLEQLTNAESAEVLAITVSSASKRYMRGLRRIRRLLCGADDDG